MLPLESDILDLERTILETRKKFHIKDDSFPNIQTILSKLEAIKILDDPPSKILKLIKELELKTKEIEIKQKPILNLTKLLNLTSRIKDYLKEPEKITYQFQPTNSLIKALSTKGSLELDHLIKSHYPKKKFKTCFIHKDKIVIFSFRQSFSFFPSKISINFNSDSIHYTFNIKNKEKHSIATIFYYYLKNTIFKERRLLLSSPTLEKEFKENKKEQFVKFINQELSKLDPKASFKARKNNNLIKVYSKNFHIKLEFFKTKYFASINLDLTKNKDQIKHIKDFIDHISKMAPLEDIPII